MLFENQLERKINKKPMGGSLGKFRAVLFLSARLQKSEREGGSEREQSDGKEEAKPEDEEDILGK